MPIVKDDSWVDCKYLDTCEELLFESSVKSFSCQKFLQEVCAMERGLLEVNATAQVIDDVSMNGSSQGRHTPEFRMTALSATDPITTMMGNQK